MLFQANASELLKKNKQLYDSIHQKVIQLNSFKNLFDPYKEYEDQIDQIEEEVAIALAQVYFKSAEKKKKAKEQATEYYEKNKKLALEAYNDYLSQLNEQIKGFEDNIETAKSIYQLLKEYYADQDIVLLSQVYNYDE